MNWKNIFLILVLLGGIMFAAGNGAGKGSDSVPDVTLLDSSTGSGQSDTVMSSQGSETNSDQTEPQGKQQGETIQEKDQNKTQDKLLNQTKDQEKNQTHKTENKTANNAGISDLVQQVIEMKKNGSLTVPQGMIVRILAHERTMNFGNDTNLTLTEMIQVQLMVNGRNKSITIKPSKNGVNVSDDGVTVETEEELEVKSDGINVGGKKVTVMPSDLPVATKAKNIKSAKLEVKNGNPTYSVNATKKSKFLWLFDANMDVSYDVDATDGKITKQNWPWWAFLADVQKE